MCTGFGRVLSDATDELWTLTAGSPFGATTFSNKGVLAPLYFRGGLPVQGVMITRDPAGVVQHDDYYFSDDDPWSRTTVDVTQNATGTNGTGLMVNSALVDHGGTGGLPATCVWKDQLGKSIAGVMTAVEIPAVLSTNGDPCPP